MATSPDWPHRLNRWPLGVIGEFLGTISASDTRAVAARRWLRRLFATEAQSTALLHILRAKGIISQAEYDSAVQVAALQICKELEKLFPGISATDEGVDIDLARAGPYMQTWPR